MKYRVKFLLALVVVYFGVFPGITLSGSNENHGKHNQRGNNPQHRQGDHRQLRKPEHRVQPQSNQRVREDVREDRKNNHRDRKEINRDRQGGDSKNNNHNRGNVERNRRQHDQDGHRSYDGWRGHRDFRPAHRHDEHYRERERHFRHFMNHERYRTWRQRHVHFYRNYHNRQVIVYYDWVNPYWNYVLLDHAVLHPDYVVFWVYHHRYEMDVLRYRALLREIVWLEARILELEQRGVPIDPNYFIPGIDEDLVYSQEYIERYFGR